MSKMEWGPAMPEQPQPERIERRAIAVLVDNEPGVLARVIGLFFGPRIQYRQPDRYRGQP